MDVAIPFTQNFVDKQNVRSYGNLIKLKLLKESKENLYLLNIFEDPSLVSALTPKILQILSTLRENLRVNSKLDFKNYFSYDKKEELNSINKSDIFENCWKALCDIIPKSLFGNSQNEFVFRKIVESAVYGMKRQHILFAKFLIKWDYSIQPWNTLQETISNKVLNHILLWIIRNILCAMISLNFHVTTCKLDGDENKLHFFWKHQWQRFYDKVVYKMKCHDVIKMYAPYSMGRKFKRHRSHASKIKLKTYKKYIPKLHLVLKANNDCRPIVRYKTDVLTMADKYKIKDRLNFLKMLNCKPHKKTEHQFIELHSSWLKLNKPKLYFIKTDLSDAFGCVNREKLLKILHERYSKYHQEETNVQLLEKNSQKFKDMTKELGKPLLIRAGSTVYEWKRGLVQGYKYSPALSELYYSYLDEQYFTNHIKKSENEIKLFVRVVDDYLYVTNSLDDAQIFLKALSNYENVNAEKTEVNFDHPTIKFSNEITFLGYCYNTNTMQVSRAQTVFTGPMCYKITFNNTIDNIYKFLEARIGQSSIQINGHVFNFFYNSEDMIWGHIFTTFCISANKFCTILAILCDGNEMLNCLHLFKKKVTVKLSNTMIDVLTRNKPVNFMFVYCINHFRYISWLALSLCAKKTPKCSKLVPYIKDEMAKSNCLFGKWKDHAARIDTNGNILRPAVRDVCKRPDLKLIMKKFDTLPSGFQCYNYKDVIKG